MSRSVYAEQPDENYAGARERTRPGMAPGETKYDSVTTATGERVSAKPANKAIIAGQRARLERERLRKEKEEKRARAPGRAADPSWTLTGVLSRLVMLVLFIPMLSHFMTGTYTFNLEPTVRPFLRKAWLHPMNPLAPPLREFTLIQLEAYDGSDPSQPVYLSIGGDVYDVSANRRIYGRGGSYNMMAGRDASRAFVTGCFETHLTHDLRGLNAAQLKSLEGWKSFFANHERYHRVGQVILTPIDPDSPIPPPCRGGADQAPGAAAAAHGEAKPGPVKATGR